MKKYLLLFFTTIILSASNYAQTEEEATNIVKINIPGYFALSGSASYERVLGEKSSVQADAIYGTLEGNAFKTYGFGISYKYYLSKSKIVPQGFYGSVGGGYSKLTVVDNNTTYKAGGFMLRSSFGYQWVFNNRLSLDLFGGVQRLFSKLKDDKGNEFDDGEPTGSGIITLLPVVGLSVGYSF